MIGRLIRLAVLALVANATYRVGVEYITYVRFRDAIREAATFRAATDAELRGQIMELADDYDVPLEEESIAINRENLQVFVAGWYLKPIELVPKVPYRWRFSWSIQAVTRSPLPRPTDR